MFSHKPDEAMFILGKILSSFKSFSVFQEPYRTFAEVNVHQTE